MVLPAGLEPATNRIEAGDSDPTELRERISDINIPPFEISSSLEIPMSTFGHVR